MPRLPKSKLNSERWLLSWCILKHGNPGVSSGKLVLEYWQFPFLSEILVSKSQAFFSEPWVTEGFNYTMSWDISNTTTSDSWITWAKLPPYTHTTSLSLFPVFYYGEYIFKVVLKEDTKEKGDTRKRKGQLGGGGREGRGRLLQFRDICTKPQQWYNFYMLTVRGDKA